MKTTYIWCWNETFSRIWSGRLNSRWRYRRMWEVVWGMRNGSFWKMRTAQSVLSWWRMIAWIADVVIVFVVVINIINSLWRSLRVRDWLTCYYMSDCFSIKPFFHFLQLSKQIYYLLSMILHNIVIFQVFHTPPSCSIQFFSCNACWCRGTSKKKLRPFNDLLIVANFFWEFCNAICFWVSAFELIVTWRLPNIKNNHQHEEFD